MPAELFTRGLAMMQVSCLDQACSLAITARCRAITARQVASHERADDRRVEQGHGLGGSVEPLPRDPRRPPSRVELLDPLVAALAAHADVDAVPAAHADVDAVRRHA